MNRVYKVIWSKAKHCYVVTSEIAKSHTKGESTGRGLKKLAAALLVAAALMGPNFAWAADGMATVKDTTNAEQTVYTQKGADDTFATKTDLANYYVKKAGAEVTNLTAARDVEAGGNLKVGNGNFKVEGITGDVTTGNATIGGALTVKGDTEMKGDLGVKGNLSVEGVFAGGDTADAAKASLNADGSIKGADGEFAVGTDGSIKGANGKFEVNAGGQVTAKGGVNTAGAEINTAGGKITAGAITGTQLNTQGGDIIGGKATVTELTTQGGDISGGDITATGLNTQGGEINGGDIKSSGTIQATGKITGNGLDAGTGAISGGRLSVTGAMEGNSLTLKGGNLNAGSGTITTTGNFNGNNINATGKITTTSLEVTDGLKTDHITLGSETNNYTDINKGNVTSQVHEIDGAVEYTAVSVFKRDGSSITARTDKGTASDSTGISKVGANEISQYLGDNAEPESSQKNVTRKMVRNDGGTFRLEDKVVDKDGNKSSIVSQNAGERKVELKEGTKTLTVTENLTNGIVSETKGDDGTVTLTQGMDGTYKVKTSGASTEDIGGQKIENYNGGLDTNITGNETHDVSGDMTTTVTGDSSLSATNIKNKASTSITSQIGEDGKVKSEMTAKGITNTAKDGTITNDAKDVFNKGTNSVINEVSNNQVAVTTGSVKAVYGSDTSTTWDANGITSATSGDMKNNAKNITNTATKSITDKVGENVERTMGTKKIEEFVKDAEGNRNASTKTATKDINVVTDGTNTSTESQLADSVNTSLKAVDADGKTTKSLNNVKTVSEDTTKITDTASGAFSSSSQKVDSITNTVKNGNGSNVATDKALSSESKLTSGSSVIDVIKSLDDAANPAITSSVTDGTNTTSVAQTAKDITNTAENGTITNTAQTVKTITGNNTVTSNTDGTTFENTGANTPVEVGNEQGSRTDTKIKGNTVETGKVETDFADVNNNLTVGGSTTLGRDGGNTNLTVNSKSTFRDTVKMEKTLEVDGESTFNNKVTITKGGLDVKGGTTTDTLTVTGDSEFVGRADFRDNVFMDENLTVAKETRTGTLYVNNDGYVDGNLYVEGNIETHDAELSENSRQVVTGRQLYQTNERVDRLDNRIKKVGANAAALAALRPGDFNPDDKFSIAAGFGSYRNASAAALGLFYRPNENVILSLGTSFGDGENMVNAGVSVKFGRGKSMAERRKEMADEVSSMRDEMRSQDERIAELEEMLKKQSELIEKLSKES